MATKKPTSPKKPVKKPTAKKPTPKKTTTKKVTDTTQKITAGVAKAEQAVDKAVNTATSKAKKAIGSKNTKKVTDFAHKADALADKASDFADQADTFAQDVLPTSTGSDIDVTADWEEKVSRLFFLRVLRMIIEYWVLIVRGCWIALISIIHFFSMIITGRRSRNLWDRQYRFLRHVTKRGSYIKGFTDKRPEFISPK